MSKRIRALWRIGFDLRCRRDAQGDERGIWIRVLPGIWWLMPAPRGRTVESPKKTPTKPVRRVRVWSHSPMVPLAIAIDGKVTDDEHRDIVDSLMRTYAEPQAERCCRGRIESELVRVFSVKPMSWFSADVGQCDPFGGPPAPNMLPCDQGGVGCDERGAYQARNVCDLRRYSFGNWRRHETPQFPAIAVSANANPCTAGGEG